MTAAERRERQRAERHQLIITAARELAEAEGWEAVTTRKLADRVEYSQPVLYGHFANMEAIRDAVAVECIAEMAEQLHEARQAAPESDAIRAVCTAYLDYAAAHPAAYQAMFTLPTKVKFAHAETPAPLRQAFNEFVSAFGPYNDRNAALAELIWGSLHGMAVLLKSGRIPEDAQRQRLDLLITLFAKAPA
ncbi:TetR/AcrR family transcriptional regulator [Glycomyces niveus]|uniref:Helix-turn-helix transcriptional regulator n=1 Tax=Glycomyces niveus TaxID=2820287 RepID=A0ABS3U8G0_9ACTN|nr:TetR/AcrR family transcriptional regulator [Glycomyces sp. NEAU-S30]MBO3734726.1 helix-turn-helix transcriptional regulator [Glycomyces sp. NEAU-S30]